MQKYLIKDEPIKGDLISDGEEYIEDNASSPEQHFIPINNEDDQNRRQLGLSMEEILKYQRDPFYVRLRWFLCILIFLLLAGMIAFVVAFVIMAPPCPYRPKLQFSQKEIMYQVELATFKDSTGDGVGDLNGIVSKLDYLRDDLGARVICLRRLMSKATPMEIDSEYGTHADLKHLRKEVEKRDMFMLLDLPASYLESKDQEIIEHWLTKYADGLRIVEGKNPIKESEMARWKELVQKVSDDTFKHKYIGVVDKNTIGLDVETLTSPDAFTEKIQDLYKTGDNTIWPNLNIGNYEASRLSTVLEKNLYDIANSLVLLLKGTPVLLAGDEIRLKGRNEIEKYMQWDNSEGCGFTENKQVAHYFKNVTGCKNAVLNSIAHTTGGKSLVKIYNELSELRRKPSLSWGEVKFNSSIPVVSFVREAAGFAGYLVAANTGMTPETIDFAANLGIPNEGTLAYFYSPDDMVTSDEFVIGEEISLDNVLLRQGQLLVAEFSRN